MRGNSHFILSPLLKKAALRFGVAGAMVLAAWGFYWLFFRPPVPTPPQCLIQSVGQVQALALSPDGRTLADASELDRVTLYDAVTGREGPVLPIYSFWIAFSRDGRRLLTSGEMTSGESRKAAPLGTQVSVWDVATGRRLSTLSHQAGTAELEAFSSDLTHAVLRESRFCFVYDLVTGKSIKAFTAPSGLWNSAFSPDGRLLAVGNETGLGDLLLWDMKTGQPIHALDGQAVGCERVRFSPDGTLLAALTQTGLTWWDTRTWQKRGAVALPPASRFTEHPYPRFSADSRQLVMTETRTPPAPRFWYNLVKLWNPSIYQEQPVTHVWDCGTGRETAALANQTLERVSFAGGRMLTRVSPPIVRPDDPRLFLLWDIGRGRVVSRFQITPDPDDDEDESFFSSDISDDGQVVAVGGHDYGIIRVWRTPAH